MIHCFQYGSPFVQRFRFPMVHFRQPNNMISLRKLKSAACWLYIALYKKNRRSPFTTDSWVSQTVRRTITNREKEGSSYVSIFPGICYLLIYLFIYVLVWGLKTKPEWTLYILQRPMIKKKEKKTALNTNFHLKISIVSMKQDEFPQSWAPCRKLTGGGREVSRSSCSSL